MSTPPPQYPTVTTRHGGVVGRRAGQLNVFKGVPYAKPPLGSLRFRPPEPPDSWSEPRDAGEFGASPTQPAAQGLGSIGRVSENCLTLNVWAPQAPGPHPVLFWIYGGANVYGASSQTMYDGGKYAEQGLIFISVNYRLGAFGFLELGPVLPELAGSSLNGLRDLIAALHWVQDNVAAFGGDPATVTLMGESAGAKNICALATSPLTEGLFSRVAIQSGGGHTVFTSQEEAAPVTRDFLNAAGLKPGDFSQITKMPARSLLSAQRALMAAWSTGFPFRPTLDQELLPARPVDAAATGATAHLEMIIGTCRDEAALFLPPDKAEDQPFQARQIANVGLDTMLAMQTRYTEMLPDVRLAERKIRQLTAEEYWIPSVRFAEAHVQAGGAAWMYRFDRAAKTGPLKGYAHHGCDVPFLFDAQGPEPGSVPQNESGFGRQILDLWTRWAREGRASMDGVPIWPPYALDQRATLLISGDPVLIQDPRGIERSLWKGIL